MADIVEENVGLMLSHAPEGMMGLLERESQGARGYVNIDGERCPLMGANFNYDLQTGQIINFSTSQMPEYGLGCFEILCKPLNRKNILLYQKINPYFKIINIHYYEKKETPENVKAIIKASMIEYNIIVQAYNKPILDQMKAA